MKAYTIIADLSGGGLFSSSLTLSKMKGDCLCEVSAENNAVLCAP